MCVCLGASNSCPEKWLISTNFFCKPINKQTANDRTSKHDPMVYTWWRVYRMPILSAAIISHATNNERPSKMSNKMRCETNVLIVSYKCMNRWLSACSDVASWMQCTYVISYLLRSSVKCVFDCAQNDDAFEINNVIRFFFSNDDSVGASKEIDCQILFAWFPYVIAS